MTATCPYCGAKLNPGLRFCVVCGRHVSHDSMGKLGGGLRSGFRPADITRRLDELITVARFRRSRRSHDLERGARYIVVNCAYMFVAVGLCYAAVQFSLEMLYPGKFQSARIPFDKILMLGKNLPIKGEPEGGTPVEKPAEAKPADSSENPAGDTPVKTKTRAKKSRKRSSKKSSSIGPD